MGDEIDEPKKPPTKVQPTEPPAVVVNGIPCDNATLAYYRDLLKQHEKTLAPDSHEILDTKFKIGVILKEKGEYDSALDHLEAIYGIHSAKDGQDHLVTLEVKYMIACVYREQENYSDAYKYFNEVYQQRIIQLGEHHIDTLNAHEKIATVLRDQGEYNEALKHYEDIYAQFRHWLGKGHYRTVKARFWVGRVLMKLERYEGALEHLRKVYPVLVWLLGRNDGEITHEPSHYYSGGYNSVRTAPETNIALGKPVISDPTMLYTAYVTRATDGDFTDTFYTKSAGHPYVIVDLEADALISKVYLYGSANKHLSNAIITIGRTKNYITSPCGSATNHLKDASNMGYYDVTCATTVEGRFVKMQLPQPNVYITFKEMEVFGVFV